MSVPKVDIAVACAANQTPKWWASAWVNTFRELSRGSIELGQILAIQSALPDFNKNRSAGAKFAPVTEPKRNNMTDANRDEAVFGFIEGGESGWKADWLFWIDDDTVFPDGAISRLLQLDHPFCAGLYFNANPPNNPIAYFKKKGGFYEPLWDYDEGSVLYVDSVGMGCTLIHRSVYEKIREEHVVFQRPTGSLFPIHKRNVLTWKKAPDTKDMPDTFVSDGWLHMKVIQPDNENDNRLFPYYAMEYGRTEDHYFCELAADVGIRPLIDTSIKCGHWKIGETTYEDYHQQVLIKAGLA